jgi:hypothetical protein
VPGGNDDVSANDRVQPGYYRLLAAVNVSGGIDEHRNTEEDGSHCHGVAGDVLPQVETGEPPHGAEAGRQKPVEQGEKPFQKSRSEKGNAEEKKELG